MTIKTAYDGSLVDNLSGGSFDVADTATTSTPIVIPGTSTFIQLTNDGLGTQTNNLFGPVGITELWDTTNDEFDFTQLKLGDIVHIRADINVITASPNTQVELQLEAGIGVFAFSIGWATKFFSSAGTFPLVRSSFITMQTSTILTGTAQFKLKADKASTCIVNGWNYVIIQRG